MLERGWTPKRLRTGLETREELEQLCLEEVIGLRDQEQPHLSLGLIDVAQGLGLQSPWLDDNRARALLLLGEEDSARSIWQALAGHSDPAVAAVAEEMGARGVAAVVVVAGDPAPEAWREREALITLLACSGHDAGRLQEGFHSREELEQACLEEAILLREEGNPGLSLNLITTAQELGFSSPWLKDNQARALVVLNRKQEAFLIWEELSACPDEPCAAMAADMLRLLRNSLLEPLWEECVRQGWMPRQLDSAPHEGGSPLESALREVIACREEGRPEVSLALVELCCRLGWTSSWLRDNQARALVHLNHVEEAVALWRDLATEQDPFLRSLAAEMLQLYGTGVERVQGCRQAQVKLEAGESEAAKELLIQALLQDPDAREYRELLLRVIESQLPTAENDLLQRELTGPTLRLEMYRLLLETLEQEQQPEPL
ncbi:MAG: hypothetical protein ACOVNL_14610 [Prochlorococcaceae cyanobacterium]